MKIQFGLGLVFLFFLTVGAYPQRSDDTTAKAKELWEKVIAAKGGRERLRGVKTFLVSTNRYNRNDKREFRRSQTVEFFDLPGKCWWWIDPRPGFPLQIWQYDFEREIGYEIAEGTPSEVDTHIPKIKSGNPGSLILDDSRFNNTAKELFLETQLLYLMETKWFQPKIERLRTERVNRKTVSVIDVTFGRDTFSFFIDDKTSLPERVEIRVKFDDGTIMPKRALFMEDYVDVAGIKLPQVVRERKSTETKTSYEINVDYNKALFSQPPRINMGPDAWKPAQKR